MKTLKIMSIILFAYFAFIPFTGALSHVENDNPVNWLSLGEAQEASADDGKPLFVFVEAEWCGICKRMLKNVFPNDAVSVPLMEKYHPVSIDLDSKKEILFNGETMTEREFARKMEVQGTPTTIFFSAEGEELGRQVGFIDTDELNLLLTYITSDQFPDVPLEEFKRKGR